MFRLRVVRNERRNAPWKAHVLLAVALPAIPETDLGVRSQARQRLICRGQNPAGLSWVVARMQRWSRNYREACWIGWEELLLSPNSRQCAVIN